MNFICIPIMMAAGYIFSWNSYDAIRQRTNTWRWHISQWMALGLFMCAGYFYNEAFDLTTDFHALGEWLTVGGTAICTGGLMYVFNLHYLLRK